MQYLAPLHRRRARATPLATLRAYFTDAELPGIYPASNARGGSLASVVDDARCETSTGRYYFPGITGQTINIGNLTALNGATQVTIIAWLTARQLGGMEYFCRGDLASAATRQIEVDLSGSNLFQFGLSDGATRIRGSGATSPTAGATYKVTWVFDGAQATDALRLVHYRSQRQANGTYPADASEVVTFTGTVPAALVTVANADAIIGDFTNGATQPWAGFIDELRIWIGTALSQAQVQAETLSANPVPASLRYTFAGNANNTGSTPGFNGTVASGVVQCSDDSRWGKPRVSSGSNRPGIVASVFNSQPSLRYDGLDDYMLDFGGFNGAKTYIRISKLRSVPGAATYRTALNLKSATPRFDTMIHTGDSVNYHQRILKADNAANGLAVGVAEALDTNAHIFGWTYNGGANGNPASYTAQLDGVAKAVAATTSNVGFTSTEKGAVGANVSSAGAVTQPADEDVGLEIIISRVATQAEMLMVAQLFASTYGLSV